MSDVCKYIQVGEGDGCWSLAKRCGISEANFLKYNSAPNLCANLLPDQYVCCSKGSLPGPKPDESGNCFVYIVEDGDLCIDIAEEHKMEANKIDDYNKLTWGWTGCNNLQRGSKICLSEGKPPFPAADEIAMCGPQKPGTKEPSDGTPWDWADLNPCPLNACCNKWGQCGITPEFCTNTTAPGGAPGTAKKGTNGCFSNCGTKVKSASSPIDEPRRIGYFEAWNYNRKCAHMDISKMTDGDYYTHVHWSFGNITDDWQVDVSGLQDQFDGLLELQNIQRIMSFGGWDFSTKPETYHIFRNGVKDGNRQILANNIVDFIVDNDLDGVDFDWEYPGAQDMPDIPPDSLDSGKNYAEFLKLVRDKLPKGKSLSMALPASYWYLKGFHPVTQYEDYIDYYVYMTYDLHGQWDYGNTFVNEGCPNGNCLRSHVNKTETEYTLAMVTKAGIPSTKVVPGLALYGRSFQMTDKDCKDPECTFTGEESGATKGVCTDTAGYISNIEIQDIIRQESDPDKFEDVSIYQYEDEGDVLIYNGDQWVSWLSPSTYDERRKWYDNLNLGGNVDWAVDLNRTYSNNGKGDLVEVSEDWPGSEPCPNKHYKSLGDLLEAEESGSVPKRCIAEMTLNTLLALLDDAYDDYNDVNKGYDEMFDYYVDYIERIVPATLEHAFMWNASVPNGESIWPKPGYGMNYFDCHFPEEDDWIPCSRYEDHDSGLTFQSDPVELRMDNEDDFTKGLARAGLLDEWVDLGDYEIERTNYEARPPHRGIVRFEGWPNKNESMVVQNPKKIVTDGLTDIPKLRSDMEGTMMEIAAGRWTGGDTRDAALAYAPAVFMLQQAVDSMAQAKELGEEEEKTQEEEERERKANLIVMIISVVLLFVPVVGAEVAAGLGFANLARIIAIAGELGNLALATYDTVNDPSSAVVNILGGLFGVGGITKASRDAKGLSDVANWRKGMKAEEITSLGKIFKDGDDKVQSLLGKVCKL